MSGWFEDYAALLEARLGSPGPGLHVSRRVTNPILGLARLLACLFSLDETDLRGPLRAGATDAELAALTASCVAGKWAGHRIGDPDFVRPARSMSQIGG